MKEFNIKELVRENIRDLQGYSCARNEFIGEGYIFLDANENPFDTGFNRYPDPVHHKLRGRIAKLKGVDKEQIILGNGSDELIDLLIRLVCRPGRDSVILFSPGYSMYEVSARINDIGVKRIDLDANLQPSIEDLQKNIDEETSIIFFCTPNNPIGNTISLSFIEEVALQFHGLVVVDEAYIDFCDSPSVISLFGRYPNVVVLQTLSKAWGFAGLRIGICMADMELIKYLYKIKPPYNISSIAQQQVYKLLDYQEFCRQVEIIKQERLRVYNALVKMPFLERVYPSEANFILLCCSDHISLYRYLIECGVVVRIRNIPPLISGGLRITIGTPRENDIVLQAISNWGNGLSSATITNDAL